jgi:hypothetical protein
MIALFIYLGGTSSELMGPSLVGKWSTTLAMPLAHFDVAIFERGFLFYALANLDYSLFIYTSHVAGMTGFAIIPSFYWLRWVSLTFLLFSVL